MRAILTQEVGVAATDVALEGRVLARAYERAVFTVATNVAEDGWTDFGTPTTTFYVSSSTGNDLNGGEATNDAFATLSAGYTALTNGQNSHLLLRRGDTWNEVFPDWNKSGAGGGGYMLVSAFGDEATAMPFVRSTNSAGPSHVHLDSDVHHLAIAHLELYSTNFYAPHNGGAQSGGLTWISTVSNIILEGCYVHRTRHGVRGFSTGHSTNILLNRCHFHSNGSYGIWISANSVDTDLNANFEIRECSIYLAGWQPTGPDGPNLQTNDGTQVRGLYVLDSSEEPIISRRTWWIRDSTGPQFRTGGDVTNNVFIRAPLENWGFLSGGGTPINGGVTGNFTGNLDEESMFVSGGGGACAPQAGNLGITNLVNYINKNIGINPDNSEDLIGGPSLEGRFQITDTNSGLHNVQILSNFIWGVQAGGISVDGTPGFRPPTPNVDVDGGYSQLVFRGNQIYCLSNGLGSGNVRCLELEGDPEATTNGVVAAAFYSNTYWHERAEGAAFSMLGTGAGDYSNITDWENNVTASNETILGSRPTFTDSNAGYSSFVDSIEGGSGATLTDLVAKLVSNRRGNWNTNYGNTLNIINHVRAGFDLPSI